MEDNLKTLDYGAMVNNSVSEDYHIGEDIILLKTYIIEPVDKFEYVASDNMIIEIMEGEGYFTVDGTVHEVSAPCMLFIMKGQHIKTNITKKALQRSAILSDRFLEVLFQAEVRFHEIKTFMLANPVVQIDSKLTYALDVFCKVLVDIAVDDTNINKFQCAKHLTLTLFYGPLYGVLKKKGELATYRTPNIVKDFFKLLEINFREQHTVDFYADKLCISTRYLYTAVLSATSKTPSYWIDHYLFVEAKNLIDQNQMTILQISQELNFAALPSFSKFFKRMQGVSPSDYRRSIFE